MREYRATSLARATKTATFESPESDSTEFLTSRSSIPPPRTISSATASPLFQAATTSFGSPGPGISASGVTIVVGAGSAAVAPALGGLELGVVAPSGETVTGVVVPGEELEAGGVADELLDDPEPLFFFTFIMKKSPTTRTSTPITAIWTAGLPFSAFLILP